MRIIKKLTYAAGWLICKVLFTIIWRRKVVGREHVPRTGPVIVASNHRSNADPLVIGSALHREVHFIAKQELFRIPVLGTLIALVNGFPVKRGQQDIRALKTAQQVLQDGNALLMFPEGRRIRGDEFVPPKPGVAMLAQVSQAPVVPALVVNTDRLGMFKKVYVEFGRPLFFTGEAAAGKDRSEAYRAFSRQIMETIKIMREHYKNKERIS